MSGEVEVELLLNNEAGADEEEVMSGDLVSGNVRKGKQFIVFADTWFRNLIPFTASTLTS